MLKGHASRLKYNGQKAGSRLLLHILLRASGRSIQKEVTALLANDDPHHAVERSACGTARRAAMPTNPERAVASGKDASAWNGQGSSSTQSVLSSGP